MVLLYFVWVVDSCRHYQKFPQRAVGSTNVVTTGFNPLYILAILLSAVGTAHIIRYVTIKME
jgi:hypothetical protein